MRRNVFFLHTRKTLFCCIRLFPLFSAPDAIRSVTSGRSVVEFYHHLPSKMNDADLPHLVIGACMTVHSTLGPGLTREAYEECLAVELRDLEMDVQRGLPLSFDYRGRRIQAAARLDFVIHDRLLLQVLAQEEITALDKLRFESHLRLSHLRSGVLVNFNVSQLRKGIHRIILKRKDPV